MLTPINFTHLFTKGCQFIMMLILFKQHHRHGTSSYVRRHFTCSFISISGIFCPWDAGLPRGDESSWCSRCQISCLLGFLSSNGCLSSCVLSQWNISGPQRGFWISLLLQHGRNKCSILQKGTGFSVSASPRMHSHSVALKKRPLMEMRQRRVFFPAPSLHLTVKYSGLRVERERIILFHFQLKVS